MPLIDPPMRARTPSRRTVVAGAAALIVAGRATAQTVPLDDWAEADAIVARIRPPVFPSVDFAIAAYGAKADQPAHLAVQAAIDACAAGGGGRVVVPSGLWIINGALHLRSNVELHLERGATLRFGRPDEIDLPIVLTRWEGTEVYNFSPLIYARDCENVAITGPGLLDGQGRRGFFKWRAKQNADKAALRQMGATGLPVEQRRFGPGHYLRPAFVQFFGCRNVLIDGPKFIDSPFWTIHPVYSRNVIVRNVRVVSKHLNSDAVDPDSCEDVLIEQCRFSISDDCIAIKSGRDRDGWRVGRPTRNVVIRDCVVSTSIAAGIAIGSEMSGGVQNVFVERVRIKRAEHAIFIKSNINRGGAVKHLRIRDIRVGHCVTLINLTTGYHARRGGKSPPIYRDFVVERVTCSSTREALHIVGTSSAPIDDVTIRAVTVTRADGTNVIEHARGLRLDRVSVNGRFE